MRKTNNVSITSYDQANALIQEIIAGERYLENTRISIDKNIGGIVIH